jgi:hypothetical protein
MHAVLIITTVSGLWHHYATLLVTSDCNRLRAALLSQAPPLWKGSRWRPTSSSATALRRA